MTTQQIQERMAAVRKLAEQSPVEGERAAAREALKRLEARLADSAKTPVTEETFASACDGLPFKINWQGCAVTINGRRYPVTGNVSFYINITS